MELIAGAAVPRLASDRLAARTIGLLRQVCKGLSVAHAGTSCTATSSPTTSSSRTAGPPESSRSSTSGSRCSRPGTTVTDAHRRDAAYYMRPEIIDGDPFDARVDIYAVGCIAYEMLIGYPPFVGTIQALLFAHRYAPQPSRSADPSVRRAPAGRRRRPVLSRQGADRVAAPTWTTSRPRCARPRSPPRLETAWDDLALPDVRRRPPRPVAARHARPGVEHRPDPHAQALLRGSGARRLPAARRGHLRGPQSDRGGRTGRPAARAHRGRARAAPPRASPSSIRPPTIRRARPPTTRFASSRACRAATAAPPASSRAGFIANSPARSAPSATACGAAPAA